MPSEPPAEVWGGPETVEILAADTQVLGTICAELDGHILKAGQKFRAVCFKGTWLLTDISCDDINCSCGGH